METIGTKTIIHQAAKLYLEAFDLRSVAATTASATELAGQMQGILDIVVALGLNVSDVIIETRNIIAAEEEAR